MSDSRQAGFSRRLNSTNSTNDSSTTTNLGNRLTSLESTTSDQFTQTRAALESTNQNLLDTTSLLEFHTSTDNVTGFNARITALENAPPSTGGGGIDPTEPEPVIISENYVPQMQDWAYSGGAIQILSTTAYGTVTSPRIFQTSGSAPGFGGNNMYIVSANSETDHFGVIEIVVEDGVTGVLSLSQNSAQTICVPSDITRMVAIVKTPASFPSGSSFIVGFATDLYTPTEGIYFIADPTTNKWICTVNNGTSTSSNNTVALTTNTWYTLEIIKVTSSSFDFKINGTTVNLNTNVPTDPLNCGLWVDNVAGSSPSQLKVKLDFFSLKLRGTAGGTLPTGATVQGTTNEIEVNLASNVYTVGLPTSIIVDQATVDQLNFDTTLTPVDPLGDGVIAYDPAYQSLIMGLDGGATNTNISAPLGSTLVKLVRNQTGTTITKGQVVYINGSHGSTHIKVDLADASDEATAKDTIGVAAHDIANNTEGWIITQGYLKGLTTNTTPGTGGEGSTIWLSTTAGSFTYDRPLAPNHGVVVGFMVKSAGSGAGSIYVKVSNGQELEELHDVLITGIANNDILQWDNTDLRWENRSLATAGIAAATLTLTAGTGLTGGGDLTANRSFAVDFAASGTSSATKAVRADDIRLADPTDPLSPVLYVEDFLNQNNEAGEIGVHGWNFVNVTIPQMAGELNHPGIVRIRCSATANQVGYMTTALTSAGGTNQFSTDNLKEFTIIFRDVQTELDTYRVYGMCGVATSTTAQFSGIYLRKNITGVTAGTWQFVTRTAAGAETATTFQTQDTNWHKMKVTYSAGSVSFYMDGATSPNATHVTNIPTGLIVAPYLVLIPTGASTIRTSDWDFISYTLNSITR